jgi:hypothetical protein
LRQMNAPMESTRCVTVLGGPNGKVSSPLVEPR